MKSRRSIYVLAALMSISSTVVQAETLSTRLYIELPEYCPTPDALAVAPDGSLTLTCPNYASRDVPGNIVKITPEKDVIKLAEIEVPGSEGKATPMGLAYGPDGALYVCASLGNNGHVLRLVFENDTLTETEIIASGIQGPNGLRYHNGALYVTTPMLPKIATGKNTGGVYRFNTTDRDIKVNNDRTDANLIHTVDTQNPDKQFGLDGLEFDPKGRLLVGDFGDGVIYRLTLNDQGKVIESETYADLETTGIDGMVFDENGNLYVTGFSKNKLFKVDPERNVAIAAAYPDNDGSNGELDQPVDLVIHDGKLIISNFDLMAEPTMVNTSHSKPYTLSFIPLDELNEL